MDGEEKALKIIHVSNLKSHVYASTVLTGISKPITNTVLTVSKLLIAPSNSRGSFQNMHNFTTSAGGRRYGEVPRAACDTRRAVVSTHGVEVDFKQRCLRSGHTGDAFVSVQRDVAAGQVI